MPKEKPIAPPRRTIGEFADDAQDFIRWSEETKDRALAEAHDARKAAAMSESYQALERLGTTGLMFWSWQCQRELDALRGCYDIGYMVDHVLEYLGMISKKIEEKRGERK